MMTCTLMISTAIEIPPSVVPCSAAVSHSKIMPFMTHRPSTPEPKTTSRPGWLEGNRRERFPSTMRGGIVVYAIFQGLMLSQRSAAQIPRACADRQSLEQMTCCPVTDDGVCGEDAERGECDAVNFERHRNDTTDVRVNWPHYYTRVCKCSGNFGGYDCSRCAYGYYGKDCASRAIIPQRGGMGGFRCRSGEDQDLGFGLCGRVGGADAGSRRPEHGQRQSLRLYDLESSLCSKGFF